MPPRAALTAVAGALLLAACSSPAAVPAADPAPSAPATSGPGGSAVPPAGPAATATPGAPPDDAAPTGDPAQPTPSGQPPATVELAFGGDVHFEGAAGDRLRADPRTALGPIRSVLSRADLAVVNLETAVTTRGTAAPKAFVFRAPSSAFAALEGAGVDVATMANNHSLDYGVVGMRDSLAAARRARFPVVGIGEDEDEAYRAFRTTVRGQRIALVGVSNVIDDALLDAWTAGPGKPGLASAKRAERLTRAVADARRDSDLVVVYLHWGVEKDRCPSDEQRALERLLVGAGADVIVGSHTHTLLGGGWAREGPYVDFGLGNFAFYASGRQPGTESGVLRLRVRGREVTRATWLPARIEGGVPVPASGADARRINASKADARACTDLRAAPPG